MSAKMSRRKLLRKGSEAIVAGSIGTCAAAVAGSIPTAAAAGGTPVPTKGVDYYEKLGLVPFINAAGTYTILSASTMPDAVQAAIALAAKKPVHLLELHEAAGTYLAQKLRCGGALVTSGAAAGLTLGTAACMTMGNKEAIVSIPTDLSGLKNEVIVQKAHRYEYDHAMRNCGVKVVEVQTLEQYQDAFTDKTVMTNFFNAVDAPIGREDWVRVAHQHGVPCFNDAAADVPPISNLWNYTQMGFDLVAFSGGKGMRGPQCTGLLLGRKDLTDAARLNNSPNSNAVGRGLKVAKEDIIGMVAAVDWFLSQDDAAMEAEFRKRADRIAELVKKVPTVETTIFIPTVANHVPHLLVTYDPAHVRTTGLEVMQKMRAGKPRIELNPGTGGGPASAGLPGGEHTIIVGVWMLQPGEDLIVGRRLREVLQNATHS
ncbi:MAG TPA: aminotransferase class V-fold PLP-dependent enzyme [Candidatus Eisenbacteria bacterium]|nr:aminotransferase class V-fold PLP-dependent enzyme [Candidatus Eisenbacteria bacterium]